MLSWGGSWASGKVLVGYMSPELIVFWRFLITWVTFLPIMFWMKQPFKISLKDFRIILAASLILLIYNAFFLVGLTKGYAGTGGVIVTTTMPIMTTILLIIFFKKPTSVKDYLGLALGVTGAAIILEIWHLDFQLLIKSGNLLFIIAALTWATLSILTSKLKTGLSMYTFSFYLFFVSSLLQFIFVLKFNYGDISVIDGKFLLNIFILAFFATTYGTTVYFIGTQKLGSDKASSFTFLVPASALFFSWFFLHEPMHPTTVIGGAIALFAVYLINIKKAPAPAAVKPQDY